jgi:hypothetical protein
MSARQARLTPTGWAIVVLTLGLAYPVLLLFRPRSPPRPRVGVYPRSKNFMR